MGGIRLYGNSVAFIIIEFEPRFTSGWNFPTITCRGTCNEDYDEEHKNVAHANPPLADRRLTRRQAILSPVSCKNKRQEPS